ncbi:hypothetical protein B9N43_14190 [Denitratisoma sp. DHT3]|uniref:DUF3369 domain-containing protein n=1 Tax=Denitratisoma sp. DHT3 TaxID=1981880 RepID=UPI0011984549|nr:DUF3369 domain-containing protein [Denitratisoma sp. DHT3]QDX82289.1 hypothetical protein B9N43_14190 [Denitratisoma sp. DHT3]
MREPPSDDLFFAPEDAAAATPQALDASPWKILIVDDDPGVHDVTLFALRDFDYAGRGLKFFHAYSANEAVDYLESHPDIAIALVDVVMEEEQAGLKLVRRIREEMNNSMIRLILRTGQPGQAPERTVIREYDINDYKEKAELSAQKLYSTVLACLRAFRDLTALEGHRAGLLQVIDASAVVFRIQGLRDFIKGVLEQLVALLYLKKDSMIINGDSLAMEHHAGGMTVVAATGRFSPLVDKPLSELPLAVRAVIDEAIRRKASIRKADIFAGYFCPRPGREDVIYLCGYRPLNDDEVRLIELFLHNTAIAYENILLRDDIEGTQRDMIYMLGEAIETRSKETGQHVRRVAEFCRTIALGLGLPEREADILQIAAPLHDLGKIGIPDAILHKPGKLDEPEWRIMRTHAALGAEMLKRSEREILVAASLIAGHHHEKWDGSGYPQGFSGADIHIYGRIAAVADVVDALSSRRTYKEPWPFDAIWDYLRAQSGVHFDPEIVAWVLANVERLEAIRQAFPDEGDPPHHP